MSENGSTYNLLYGGLGNITNLTERIFIYIGSVTENEKLDNSNQFYKCKTSFPGKKIFTGFFAPIPQRAIVFSTCSWMK